MSIFQTILYHSNMKATCQFSDYSSLQQSFLVFANQHLHGNFKSLDSLLNHLFNDRLDTKQLQLLSVVDRKILILAFSLLIPLKSGFFPTGFSGKKLRKIGEVFGEAVGVVSGREVGQQEEGREMEEISGEKLTNFLKGCYLKMHYEKVRYEQAKEGMQVRVRELEEKVAVMRKMEVDAVNGYNISFQKDLKPDDLSTIPLIESIVNSLPPSYQSSSSSPTATNPSSLHLPNPSSLTPSPTSLTASLILNVILITMVVLFGSIAFS